MALVRAFHAPLQINSDCINAKRIALINSTCALIGSGLTVSLINLTFPATPVFEGGGLGPNLSRFVPLELDASTVVAYSASGESSSIQEMQVRTVPGETEFATADSFGNTLYGSFDHRDFLPLLPSSLASSSSSSSSISSFSSSSSSSRVRSRSPTSDIVNDDDNVGVDDDVNVNVNVDVDSSSSSSSKKRLKFSCFNKESDSASTAARTRATLFPFKVESGWSGVALGSSSSSSCLSSVYTVCHSFCRRAFDISTADGSVVRYYDLPGQSTAISSIVIDNAAQPLTAIACRNTVTIYDQRARPPVERLEESGPVRAIAYSSSSSSSSSSYSSSSSTSTSTSTTTGSKITQKANNFETSTALMATGGDDKIVNIYDARKWKIVGSWKKASKYEILYLAFSNRDPRMLYVSDRSNELLCGYWNVSSSSFSFPSVSSSSSSSSSSNVNVHSAGFRGDGRWIALSAPLAHSHSQSHYDDDDDDDNDTIICASNRSLYVLKSPYRMIDSIDKENANANVTVDVDEAEGGAVTVSSLSGEEIMRLRKERKVNKEKEKAERAKKKEERKQKFR